MRNVVLDGVELPGAVRTIGGHRWIKHDAQLEEARRDRLKRDQERWPQRKARTIDGYLLCRNQNVK